MGRPWPPVPGLPVRPRRDLPRPCPPGGGRGGRRAGPHAAPRVELLRQPGGHRDGADDRRAAGGRRAGVLLQLGRRSQRGRVQGGPEVRGTRPPRRGQRLRQLPRADPGRAGRHRATDQARAVPTHAGGLPPRALRGSGGSGGGHRPDGGRGADRAGPRGGWRDPGPSGLPGGHPGAVRRARAADDRRRGPDRAGPHRTMVRVRARRRPSRRGLSGQGPRQRHADRRLLGPA